VGSDFAFELKVKSGGLGGRFVGGETPLAMQGVLAADGFRRQQVDA
jgi:hypothetical protein